MVGLKLVFAPHKKNSNIYAVREYVGTWIFCRYLDSNTCQYSYPSIFGVLFDTD